MSVCGSCPYPYEAGIAGEERSKNTDDYCGYGCSFEDAAYRAQWAYDRLMMRYEELEKENKLLKAEMRHNLKYMEDDGK